MMKHYISREIELEAWEIKEAIIYWLRNYCDKPAPPDIDCIDINLNDKENTVSANINWAEAIKE